LVLRVIYLRHNGSLGLRNDGLSRKSKV